VGLSTLLTTTPETITGEYAAVSKRSLVSGADNPFLKFAVLLWQRSKDIHQLKQMWPRIASAVVGVCEDVDVKTSTEEADSSMPQLGDESGG
jgi:hypothetical protein